LVAHLAHVADHRLCLAAQRRIGFDRTYAIQIGAVADDSDPFGGHTVAADFNRHVGLVRGNHAIRASARELLEPRKHMVDDPLAPAAKAGAVHLWRQIVVIEYEPYAEEFVEHGNE